MRRRHDLVRGARRHLRDGEPQLGRARRHDRARAPRRNCRSTPTATAGATCPAHPLLGWSYVAWQKIWRLAGADHMHVNGLRNKFCETDESVIASARACLTPMFADKPCIVDAGLLVRPDRRAQAPDTYAALGSADLISRPAAASWPIRTGRRPGLQACARPGTRRSPASRSPSMLARTRRSRRPWRFVPHERLQPLPDGRLVAFYGDDFTGSAAVMEVLTFAACRRCSSSTCRRRAACPFRRHRGVGIAGIARSQTPAWMERDLPPVFRALAALGAPVSHYKICSTFDSAPAGRLDRAGDRARRCPYSAARGARSWPRRRRSRRYQAFGNLFATVARRGLSGSTATRRCPAIRSRRWTRPTSASISRGRPSLPSAWSISSP